MLKGLVSAFFFAFNTVFWGVILYVVLALRWILPFPAIRCRAAAWVVGIAETWSAWNGWALIHVIKVHWRITGLEGLNPDRSYLVCANHRSWVDILALQYTFNRRIPFLRFFIKKELLSIPILGTAWRALDFPAMKRYSREFLEKHPEKRGEDLETTRRAVERFKGSPVSILNFMEGTRFTEEKHRETKSPYHHLLNPKTGGVSFVMQAMGSQFESFLDVTLFYPKGSAGLWSLFRGKVREMEIIVRRLPIPRELLVNDGAGTELQEWLRGIWAQKDLVLDRLSNGVKVENAVSNVPGHPPWP